MYVVLSNHLDKLSRDFCAAIPENVEVIEWYTHSDKVAEYLEQGLPIPSAFPSVVDIEKKFIVRRPLSWGEAMVRMDAESAPTVQKNFEAKIAEGYSIPGKDYTLSFKDRNDLFCILATIKEGLAIDRIADTDIILLKDNVGHMHEVYVAEFREIMFEYGSYFQRLWDDYHSSDRT